MTECESNAASPLVSVLVLSYRNIEGITPTLDSIMSQDYPNIEIVVSDDGTEGFDSCVPKLKSYIEQNSGSNIVSFDVYTLDENKGTVRNANCAIERSHGSFIKTISPDDVFAKKDAISSYVRFMRENGCLVAFAKLRGVDDEGNFVYRLASCEDDYALLGALSPGQILDRLYSRNFLPGAAEFFDRRVFERYGFFPEEIRLIEDYPYWIILAASGVRFGFLDEVLVDYRLSGVSSSGEYSPAFMRDMYAIYERYIFPNDRRFGPLQPVYNKLKRWGLDYYAAEARRDEMGQPAKVLTRLRYLPFHCVVRLQAWRYRRLNG